NGLPKTHRRIEHDTASNHPSASEPSRRVVVDSGEERQDNRVEDLLAGRNGGKNATVAGIQLAAEELFPVRSKIRNAERVLGSPLLLQFSMGLFDELKRNALFAKLPANVHFDQIEETYTLNTIHFRVIGLEQRLRLRSICAADEPLAHAL